MGLEAVSRAEELSLPRPLHVAREEDLDPPVKDLKDQGVIVRREEVASGIWHRRVFGRVEDLDPEGRPFQGESPPHRPVENPSPPDQGLGLPVGLKARGEAALPELPDLELPKDGRKAPCVILVRMGQDQIVQPPDPFPPQEGRHDRLSHIKLAARGAACVHQHGSAIGKADKGGISLPHVKKDHPKMSSPSGPGPREEKRARQDSPGEKEEDPRGMRPSSE
jgi:hypothetical protein